DDLLANENDVSDTDEDAGDGERPKVYGDSAYGAGEFQKTLEDHDIDSGCKTQPPSPPASGVFPKDRFKINLTRHTVTCPGRVTVPIRRHSDGGGIAYFGDCCSACPLRSQCTHARQRQADPAWQADYRANRPKVERKLAHLMFRKHGGRRARMRGRAKVTADFRLLAAAHNIARFATLGMHSTPTRWATP